MPDVHYLEPPRRSVNRPTVPQIDLPTDAYAATPVQDLEPLANTVQPATRQQKIYHAVPPHLLAEVSRLVLVSQEVERFTHQADNLVGPIGLDGILTLIPGLGGLYSAYGGLKLLGCASRARCSVHTRLSGFFLTVLDVVIGVAVGVGDIIDVFFRSHRIYGGMIQDEIGGKLVAYQAVCDQGEARGHLTQEDVTYLEDLLLRNGRKAGALTFGKVVLIGLALFVLYQLFA